MQFFSGLNVFNTFFVFVTEVKINSPMIFKC